jgi:hypothetical protein
MQSASTKNAVKARPAKKAAVEPRPDDVTEMFLAELAARRARLQELLRLIRMEVAREMGSPDGMTSRRTCRRAPAMRVRNQLTMRTGSAD